MGKTRFEGREMYRADYTPEQLELALERVFGVDTQLIEDLSSHDSQEVLGIGSATQIDELEIHWPAPSKQVERLTKLAANRYTHIVEGKGVV
jgi:ASPIC and UnbV